MKPFVITNILAPTDLSDSNVPALRYARLLAGRFAAKLTVMFAEPIVYPVEWAGPADVLLINSTPEHQAGLRAAVQQHADPVMEQHPCADDAGADLLVIGAQHKLFRDATVIGTTTERLVRFASCPVLVVPRQVVRRGSQVVAPEELVAAGA